MLSDFGSKFYLRFQKEYLMELHNGVTKNYSIIFIMQIEKYWFLTVGFDS